MKIQPYASRTMRWRKVLKHVFNPGEAWWQVFGQLAAWHEDWTKLRTVGVSNREGHHLLVAERPIAVEVLDRNHDAWLAAAERAVDEAILARRVQRDDARARYRYRGRLGVLVVTSRTNHLITCFRARVHRRAIAGAPTSGRQNERAAVRRDQRGASLQATRDTGPGEENDHAS